MSSELINFYKNMNIKPFFKKRWVKISSAIFLTATLFLLLLPVGARYYLAHWLEKNGADSATIGSLRFNPFLGRIIMEGMEVSSGGQPLLHNASMVVDFGLTSLRHRDIHLETVEYRDLSIDLEQYADGRWRFGTYTIAATTGGTDKKPEKAKEGVTEWALLADRVTLADCRIHLKTPALDILIVVEAAELVRFTTREGQPAASLTLTGLIDGSRVDLQLDSLQLVPELKITGNIAISGSKLAVAAGLLKDILPSFSGEAGLSGKIVFTESPEKGIAVEYNGIIEVGGADIGNGAFNAKAKSLKWQGLAQYSGLPKRPLIIVTDGSLAARDFSLQLPGASFVMKESLIDLSGKTTVTVGKNVTVENSGSLLIEGVDLQLPQLGLQEERVAWQGKVLYNSGDQVQRLLVQTEGLLDLGVFRVAGGEPAAIFDVSGALASWQGNASVTVGKNVTVENSGSLLIEGVDLQLPQLGLQEERVAWQGKVLYNSGDQAQGILVQTEGLLDLGVFRVAGSEPAAIFDVSGTLASWQGNASYGLEEGGPRLGVDGTFLGTALLANFTEPKIRFSQGEVELHAKSTISLGEKPVLAGLASFKAEELDLEKDAAPLLALESLVVTDLEGRGEGEIAVQSLTTTGLQANIPGSLPLVVTLQDFQLSDLTTPDWKEFAASELSLKGAVAKAVNSNRELVRWTDLAIKDIHVQGGEQVNAGNIILEGLTVLDTPADAHAKEKPALSLSRATLSEAGWSKALGLQGNSLHFDDLMAALIREKDGALNITQKLVAMQVPTSPAVTDSQQNSAKASAQEQTPIRLSKVVVGGKSGIIFTDQTLAVPLTTHLAISQMQLGAFDTSRPEDKTPFQFAGTLEDRAPLEISGDVSPFLEKPALDLQLNLKNYPLTSLSAYTVQSVGTALASGQLRLKSHAKLGDGVLAMDNTLQLQKLATETITPELAAQLNNQLPIPLDAALALLRDSEENIALDIPLNGPVSDLSVGISDVLITALGKAIIPAASGYLMYALGPYGALAYVGMKVGEKLLQVQLPPVIFQAREVALTAEHGQYLERIAMILKDRPETDMQLCPVVASWELMSEKERAAVVGDVVEIHAESLEMLLELGQQRAEVVRSHFVQNYGIDQGRLLICDTQIAKEKQTEPAVIPQL
ncbi:MAG: DUF748 domain-containing protein [Proteobacteria bacterium]|nr:DUF748 domain-containing protein [Pseudomonadota bacterium]